MYTMVLMMAMSGSPDVAEFGGRSSGCQGAVASCKGDRGGFLGLRDRGGCTGNTSCHGAVVVVASGCHGNSCHGGGMSCKGERSGFLGLRNRAGCHGGTSCHGYVNNCSCHGVPANCCGTVTTGCTGMIVTGMPAGAMAMPAAPAKEGAAKDPMKKE